MSSLVARSRPAAGSRPAAWSRPAAASRLAAASRHDGGADGDNDGWNNGGYNDGGDNGDGGDDGGGGAQTFLAAVCHCPINHTAFSLGDHHAVGRLAAGGAAVGRLVVASVRALGTIRDYKGSCGPFVPEPQIWPGAKLALEAADVCVSGGLATPASASVVRLSARASVVPNGAS